jgi:hypothetical protein
MWLLDLLEPSAGQHGYGIGARHRSQARCGALAADNKGQTTTYWGGRARDIFVGGLPILAAGTFVKVVCRP